MSKRIYIREWRKHRGLTLVQLAERVGMTQASMSRIETGKQPYSQGVLEALADALSCDPADLIGRLPGAPHELTLLVNRIPPENVETAKSVLKALAKAS
jgi:transcriptional regulator with XRE-family HTH domain